MMSSCYGSVVSSTTSVSPRLISTTVPPCLSSLARCLGSHGRAGGCWVAQHMGGWMGAVQSYPTGTPAAAVVSCLAGSEATSRRTDGYVHTGTPQPLLSPKVEGSTFGRLAGYRTRW
eukprot:GHVU01171153.1.p1 GENE.GHVU01171153.1~~GHVU01171153.1.p1  ORF type:complete len:117 (-),score=1.33 GHVU01171153.1:178-528(-)